VLGDSLTAGLGLLENQAYPALLQHKLDADGYAFEVVNAGVSGDTSAGGLRRLDWALEGDVRVLIVALGANDGLRGLSVAEMKSNLEEIIRRAREKNIVVILAGMEAPPNYGPEYTTAFRRAFQDIAREQRVVFVPFLLAKVAGDSALNQGDGIHPNPQGSAIIAETVLHALRPVLDQMAGEAPPETVDERLRLARSHSLVTPRWRADGLDQDVTQKLGTESVKASRPS
jgi:acyl-CoA thioesterase-1